MLKSDNITKPFSTKVDFKEGNTLSTLFFNLSINDLPAYLTSTNNEVLQGEMPKLYNSEISLLFFADYLAILELSMQGLQDKIDLLEKYCKIWGLKVNLKKTTILIFNKQGAVTKRHKFHFQEKEIEIVNQYTYLRFTFIPSGKKHMGVEKFKNKTRKTWFSIQKVLNKSKEKTFGTYLKFMDLITNFTLRM